MKTFEEILQQAKAINFRDEIISNDEIKAIIDNIPNHNKSFKKIWKGLTMIVPVIILISLFLAMNDSHKSDAVSKEENYTKPQFVDTEDYFDKEEDIDTKFQKLNLKMSSQNEMETKKQNTEKKQQVFYVVPDERNKYGKSVDETFPWNLKGINVLELTLEEFEKLVPNSKLNDTTFIIYHEKLIDDTVKFQRLLRKHKNLMNKYTLNDLPLAILGTSIITPSLWEYYNEIVDVYPAENYKRTLYISFSTKDNIIGKNHGQYVINASIILDNSEYDFMRQFSREERTLSLRLYNAYKEKDTALVNKINSDTKKLTNKVLKNLIPVRMKVIKDVEFVFWFYPNNEFLSKLPQRYQNDLRKELTIKKMLENGEIDEIEACKSLNEVKSIFGICKQSEGAIQFNNLYPNPEDFDSKLSLTILQKREISILIYDLTGKIVNEIISNKLFEPGNYDIDIPLDNLPTGINFVVVISNENETIVKRIIKYSN